MIGLNSCFIMCVFCFWIKNRVISMISVRGSIYFCSVGVMIFMFLMVESIEMVGVMMVLL